MILQRKLSKLNYAFLRGPI